MSLFRRIGKRILEGRGCCSSASSDCCPPESATADEIKGAVRENYAGMIKSARGQCCGSGSGVAQLAGYTDDQLGSVPEDMRETTFACGNPVAFAEMKEGEVVLDIGSGAGLDAFLAAQKVGPSGKVIGLDMTPDMIEAGRENAQRAGIENVEFRLGDADAMPVDDSSCDWIISNCVINLAPDKGKVFSEAFRVLKPGGRIMVSDIVTHGLPENVRQNMAAWVGCVGGALEQEEYLETISAAGFQNVEIIAKQTYDAETIKAMAAGCCSEENEPAEMSARLSGLAPGLGGRLSSVRVHAVKPS